GCWAWAARKAAAPPSAPSTSCPYRRSSRAMLATLSGESFTTRTRTGRCFGVAISLCCSRSNSSPFIGNPWSVARRLFRRESGSEDLESGPWSRESELRKLSDPWNPSGGFQEAPNATFLHFLCRALSALPFGTAGHAWAWEGPPGLGGVRSAG